MSKQRRMKSKKKPVEANEHKSMATLMIIRYGGPLTVEQWLL